MEYPTDWVVPNSIEEAEQRSLNLQEEIRRIELKLGDRFRKNSKGDQLSPEETNAWRYRTKEAYNRRVAEYRWTQHWLKEQHRKQRKAD